MLQNFVEEGTFWADVGNNLANWLNAHLMDIVFILFFTWLARKFGAQATMRVMSKTVRKDLYPTEADRKKRLKTLESLVNTTFAAGTWLVAAILIIGELRPSYSGTLFASAGIIGLAIGFGSQSLIKDFVNGLFIIIENQFRVGDLVTLDKVSGTVEAITLRTTILRDVDGSVHHIPNGTITLSTNKTADYGRINENLVLGENTTVEKFTKIINQIGKEMLADPKFEPKLLEAPRFDKVLGIDSKGDLMVRITAKTAPSQQARVRSELYKRLKETGEKNKLKFHT